eukprot:TRINITY_DN8300_c0_g1_i2.p1 TRINITY_DN8300_c0_g1~~TRINITY_DN8300_c0_g1_i2.p1  ORF type:complete len:333 (-),score=72.60 TRINITY_DN8300_c0_g1_i2:26-1024(-)
MCTEEVGYLVLFLSINPSCAAGANGRLHTQEATLSVQRVVYSTIAHGFPQEPGCSIQQQTIEGLTSVWLRSEERNDAKEGLIFYVHGGGWVLGSLPFYQSFLCRWSKRSKLPVLFVEYPFAPENGVNIKTQVHSLLQVFKSVQVNYSKNIVISGDSSGGHLAMLTAQKLLEDDENHMVLEKIAAVALISPVLDLERKDVFNIKAEENTSLKPSGFFFIVKSGCGLPVDMNQLHQPLPAFVVDDPGLNPTSPNSRFQGLPPVLVSVGGDEFQLPDAQLIESKCQQAGVDSQIFVGSSMQHDYIIFDGIFPEATQGAVEFEQAVDNVVMMRSHQ